MNEPLGRFKVIAPVVVVTTAALEAYHAASVGKFWLLRVPSANVSSKIVVACSVLRQPSRAKTKKLLRV